MLVLIKDLSVYAANLPSRAFGLVMKWGILHNDEQMQNWILLEKELAPKKIEPLK